MAQSPVRIPQITKHVQGILKAAGYSEGEVGVCPGKANPGCLVALNLVANFAGSAVDVVAQIDPKQTILPMSMFLAANANLTFEIKSGQTNKTIHAEGTGLNGDYTAGDFSLDRLFSQLNPLPITGPVSQDRALSLLTLNGNVAAQATRGTMLGIATDRRGRVPEKALRHHLSRFGAGRPQIISLCAKGYRSIGGGMAEVPDSWCDGMFPPGSIVPLRLNDTVLGVGGTAAFELGPLQPMIPLAFDFTGSGDTLIVIDDPQTGKTAQIEGDTVLAVAGAASGDEGSMLSESYTATDFTPNAFRSGINTFPWTQVGVMERERPLVLNISSAAGATFQGFGWAMVLDKDHSVPPVAFAYAREMFNGVAA